MPIYEYKCLLCDRVQEVIQKHDDPPPRCECNKKSVMEKVLSLGSFQLKGTGWYKTDYKNK